MAQLGGGGSDQSAQLAAATTQQVGWRFAKAADARVMVGITHQYRLYINRLIDPDYTSNYIELYYSYMIISSSSRLMNPNFLDEPQSYWMMNPKVIIHIGIFSQRISTNEVWKFLWLLLDRRPAASGTCVQRNQLTQRLIS